MEMVAASKMRRAQDRMELGKPYAQRMRAVVGHIANATPEYRHAYMQAREIKRAGYIIVSTDRGLCGGLNINLFKAAIQSMRAQQDNGVEVELCLVGAKAAGFFASVGGNVTASVRDIGEEPSIDALMIRYIESLVYQAVVENGACEQAARMIAMKNATDNAGELIDELQLVYNKARQAAITQELAEIVGGAAAIG
jgi:F0F1-type ATP synthase gamma subunit